MNKILFWVCILSLLNSHTCVGGLRDSDRDEQLAPSVEEEHLIPVVEDEHDPIIPAPLYNDAFPQKATRSTVPLPIPKRLAISYPTSQSDEESTPADMPGTALSSHVHLNHFSKLLVSTLDGYLHALDFSSGAVQWSKSFSEGPLITSSLHDPQQLVVPGIDGSLYMPQKPGLEVLRPLPVSIKEIVERSPFQVSDGTQFAGKKETRLLHLILETGELLEDHHAVSLSLPVETVRAVTNTDGDCHEGREPAALIGAITVARTEYAVEAFNAATAAKRWNISVSEYEPVEESNPASIYPYQVSAKSDGSVYFHVGVVRKGLVEDFFVWKTSLESPVSTIHVVDSDYNLMRVDFRYWESEEVNIAQLEPDDELFYVGHLNSGQLYVVPNVPAGALQKNKQKKVEAPVNIQTISEGMSVCHPGSYNYPACMTGFHILPGISDILELDNSSLGLIEPYSFPEEEPDDTDSDTFLNNTNWFTVIPQIFVVATAVWWITKWTKKWRRKKQPSDVPVDGNSGADKEPKAVTPKAGTPKAGTPKADTPKAATPKAVTPKVVTPKVVTPKGVTPKGVTPKHVESKNEPTSIESKHEPLTWSIPSSLPHSSSSSSSSSSTSSSSSSTSSSSNINTDDEKEDSPIINFRSRVELTQRVLGMGSQGTIVYEGRFEGRRVAVKRLLKQFYENASKEISLLIDSDQHPSVLRYYAREEDKDFIYVALELCKCSVADLLCPEMREFESEQLPDQKDVLGLKFLKLDELEESKLDLDCSDVEVWCPTQKTLNFLQGVFQGLAHLHSLNIVHRDIKPQNILVNQFNSPKLADMGLSKKLDSSRASFDSTAFGSQGWQAPEVVAGGRLTKAVDVFSLGCVLHYTLSGGVHPFGERERRDWNIKHAEFDLSEIEHLYEAQDLIENMICHEAEKRLTVHEVTNHPFCWDDEKQLQFLLEVSDRVEHETPDSLIRLTLESRAIYVVGDNWGVELAPGILSDITKFRKYNYSSVRDCLRVIRNKKNHYRELPEEVQDRVGPIPSGFLQYFKNLFPQLLLYTYSLMGAYCAEEANFRKYYLHLTPNTRKRLYCDVHMNYRDWYRDGDDWS